MDSYQKRGPLIGAVVISLIALFEVRRIHKPRPPETSAE